jgi:hypothetical protein
MSRNCKGQAAQKGPIWDQGCSGKKGFILPFRRNYCHQKAVKTCQDGKFQKEES